LYAEFRADRSEEKKKAVKGKRRRKKEESRGTVMKFNFFPWAPRKK